MTAPGEAQQRAERILRQTIGVQEQTPDLRALAADVLALVEENKELLGGLYLTKHNLEKAEARVATAKEILFQALPALGMHKRGFSQEALIRACEFVGTRPENWTQHPETMERRREALAGVPVAEPPREEFSSGRRAAQQAQDETTAGEWDECPLERPRDQQQAFKRVHRLCERRLCA